MFRSPRHTFHELPDLPGDYVLNPLKGWLSVIKPIARANEITNPSGETNTTNYTAGAGTLTRSTEQQYHGAYSFKYVPSAALTDGFYYGTITTVTDEIRAISCKFKGMAGVKYKLSVATTGGVDLVVKPFVGTGRWQWVWVFWKETSGTTRRIYFAKNGSTSVAAFYVDGVQSELCSVGEVFPTTYIDGDQESLLAGGQFPPVYGWNGTRHASTSYRTAQTRDGGEVKNLDVFKLLLTAFVGLGIAPTAHVASTYGYSDGAQYQGSLVRPRQFQIEARFNTDSPMDLALQQAAFMAAINLDSTSQRQPLAFLYQEYEGTEAVADVGKIIASYQDGFQLKQDNTIGEDIKGSFVQWIPYIRGHDQGSALTQSVVITASQVNNLVYKDANGVWSTLSSHVFADTISDIVQHPDGTYYIAGLFTTIGGVSANGIARYNPLTNTFSALGTGLGGAGRGTAVWVAPDGNVWVGGSFTTANGVTVNNITYWNGTTFVAIGGGTKGVDDQVEDIVGDAAGNMYFTGRFLNAGGSAAVRIVKWNGSAFSTLSTGLTGGVGFGFSLAIGLDGTTLYVGGAFDTAGGVTVNHFTSWNGTAFSNLGNGVDDSVLDLLTAPDGSIYMAGNFDATTDGLSIKGVARWTGSAYLPLGGGITSASGAGSNLALGTDGLLYLTGLIGALSGITTGDGFGTWNGSSWGLPDIDMAGTPQGVGLAVGRRGELMVFFFDGTASNGAGSAVTTLTNGGKGRTYPTLQITGPSSGTSRLHQLRNYTTGVIISFNLTIFANEVIKIITGPDTMSITSDVRGDLTQYILPGSSAEFALVPGANSVGYLVTGGAATTVATWPKRFNGVKELSYAT